MLTAAFRAFGDLLSAEFRGILVRAVSLTLLLFIAVFAAVEALLWTVQLTPWTWAEPIVAVATAFGLFLAFFFLMAPVAALFAGIYLDRIADLVEARHYPADPPGRALPAAKALLTGVRFGLIVLAVNLAVLPTLLFGIGALALVLANAYLLSREYFEMAAMRHMAAEDARQLRRDLSPQILAAGFVPAILALVPLASLLVPLFATSYFVHLFKQLRRSSG